VKRPNIVFILMDDLGWSDIGCMGSLFYETPNLDRLAKNGLRFTDAYAACPVCSPTRASILTGKYPATVGITDWIDWSGKTHPCRGKLVDVPYLKHLPPDEKTLASALRDGGYHTWHVGKWHLGGPGHYPDDVGFDVNIGGGQWGSPGGFRNHYFSPYGIPTLTDGPEGEYLPDRLTTEAIELIRNSGGTPFFLNLWYYLVHTPIQAPRHLVAKYESKAKRLGLDQIEALEENGPHPTEHKKDKPITRRIVQSDPTYAAMIESMDSNIGRLLNALEDFGILEDTLIIFTSDNGGLSTSEGSPTCNAPLSEGKGWMYEGGTREPLIVCQPGTIEPGITHQPVTSPDFFPTLLEVAGLPPIPSQHVDGESFRPLLQGNRKWHRQKPLFWHYPHYGNQGGTPGSSVRSGDFKLIEFFEDGRLELYNLRNDIGEMRNLAEAMPEKTAELKALLYRWRDSIEAKIPRKNGA
jgi:arylsulfatase A-like enzyme